MGRHLSIHRASHLVASELAVSNPRVRPVGPSRSSDFAGASGEDIAVTERSAGLDGPTGGGPSGPTPASTPTPTPAPTPAPTPTTAPTASPRPTPTPGAPKRPWLWNVVLLDDQEHTDVYVIRMMQELFAMSAEKATQIADVVDGRGRAVVVTTHKELAELKRDQILAFGKDPQVGSCSGSMSAVIEPAEHDADDARVR